MTFEAGTRIADYVVRAELRRGGLGVVYEATHIVLPRKAALEVAHDLSAAGRAIAVQLLREACVLEALAHHGVPRVYECGVLPDRRPWVARELIVTPTFEEELAAGAVSHADSLAVVRQIAEVLVHAHNRGVVHGSVAPVWVARTPDRSFPLCLRGWSGVSMQDGELEADPAGDIAALGALAFQAFTGAAVAAQNDVGRLLAQHVMPDIAELVVQMLNVVPARRPSATEVRDRATQLERGPISRPRPPRERLTTINDDPDVHVRIKR